MQRPQFKDIVANICEKPQEEFYPGKKLTSFHKVEYKQSMVPSLMPVAESNMDLKELDYDAQTSGADRIQISALCVPNQRGAEPDQSQTKSFPPQLSNNVKEHGNIFGMSDRLAPLENERSTTVKSFGICFAEECPSDTKCRIPGAVTQPKSPPGSPLTILIPPIHTSSITAKVEYQLPNPSETSHVPSILSSKASLKLEHPAITLKSRFQAYSPTQVHWKHHWPNLDVNSLRFSQMERLLISPKHQPVYKKNGVYHPYQQSTPSSALGAVELSHQPSYIQSSSFGKRTKCFAEKVSNYLNQSDGGDPLRTFANITEHMPYHALQKESSVGTACPSNTQVKYGMVRFSLDNNRPPFTKFSLTADSLFMLLSIYEPKIDIRTLFHAIKNNRSSIKAKRDSAMLCLLLDLKLACQRIADLRYRDIRGILDGSFEGLYFYEGRSTVPTRTMSCHYNTAKMIKDWIDEAQMIFGWVFEVHIN